MAKTGDIPIDVLHQLLRLDPETGTLYWRERGIEWFTGDSPLSPERRRNRWNATYAGKEAFPNRRGREYAESVILGLAMLKHRVVFAMHHGRWPVRDVDHKDTDKSNDRPGNLREATNAENQRNRGRRGGTSRFKGVSWHKGARRWQSQCCDESGRVRHLGYFGDEIAAARAYDAAALKWHAEFARLNLLTSEK